ncbi:MAG: methyltransferase domain-containing protein [Flavisolibacter sp.]|nr:methyltransferase domain-containing protein [Flavisolibacter sp.]
MLFNLQTIEIRIASRVIRLLIIDPEKVRLAYQQKEIDFPYWSKIWDSAIALSQFIDEHEVMFRKKSIVEIGAGIGLPSFAAATLADKIIVSDQSFEAVELQKKNIVFLGSNNVHAQQMDWRNIPSGIVADIWLFSDVNYDPGAFPELYKLFQHILANGSTIILATPQRLAAKDFIASIQQYVQSKEAYRVNEMQEDVHISIFVLKMN